MYPAELALLGVLGKELIDIIKDKRNEHKQNHQLCNPPRGPMRTQRLNCKRDAFTKRPWAAQLVWQSPQPTCKDILWPARHPTTQYVTNSIHSTRLEARFQRFMITRRCYTAQTVWQSPQYRRTDDLAPFPYPQQLISLPNLMNERAQKREFVKA